MNNSDLTTAEKLNKLPWSIATSALINVFLQLTVLGSVFILFLHALGLNKTQIGFLLSLVPYTGVLALFVAPLIARFGYKRTFITFNAARTISAVFLLFTPWVVAAFGLPGTLIYITGIIVLFSIARSIVITAYYPWVQEYVPTSILGKYSASNNMFTTLAGFLAVTVAGYVLDLFSGLTGFIILIAIGLVFGAASIRTSFAIPGGAPLKTGRSLGQALADTLISLRDRGLVIFLVGLALITLATVPLTSFVPLFMQEKVGLSQGNVVLIQTGLMLGGLASTYFWGWTADRYGSRPIMLSGISLYALLPLCWMLMPRHSQLSLYVALIIAFWHGVADMGWVIGSTRLLYVSIVPPERKSEYTALYYACVGVFGGTSQLLAGQMVQHSAGVAGQFAYFTLDAYTGLFVMSMILAVSSLFILRTVRADTRLTVEEFAGMFLRGNPLMAMTSLVGYHFARDESAMIAVTKRLGETRSPFTVDELLEALADPRFNVRFEAIISIARTRPHPRLTQALIEIFHGTELALSNVAAWALGRVGDQSAIPSLRQGLNSKYHSVRAHSARALGKLNDTGSIPQLRDQLCYEEDRGLQMAYASALGNLGATGAAGDLLDLLYVTQNEGARYELALALARLVGNEGYFIQLVREARTDFGTTTARAVTAFKGKVKKDKTVAEALVPTLESCADFLARDQFRPGADQLRQLIALLPVARYPSHGLTILQHCSERFVEFEAARGEYLLLALHTLEVGWISTHR